MPIETVILAASLGLGAALWADLRLRLHREGQRRDAAMHRIDAALDELRKLTEAAQRDQQKLLQRIEDQAAFSQGEMEWMLGDRLMQHASQMVTAHGSPEELAQDFDIPIDMARTVALFRKH